MSRVRLKGTMDGEVVHAADYDKDQDGSTVHPGRNRNPTGRTVVTEEPLF